MFSQESISFLYINIICISSLSLRYPSVEHHKNKKFMGRLEIAQK
jgi:hypothetical protein